MTAWVCFTKYRFYILAALLTRVQIEESDIFIFVRCYGQRMVLMRHHTVDLLLDIAGVEVHLKSHYSFVYTLFNYKSMNFLTVVRSKTHYGRNV